MKKNLLKIAVILFFNFFLSIALKDSVFAQASSGQIYQSFLDSYRGYQQKVEPFNTAKSQYLSFKSVDSQLKLLSPARNLVAAEIEALNLFTKFIRTRLAEATSILQYQENFLFIKLDDEITYLDLAHEEIINTSSIDEVKTISQELKSHYQKISEYSFQTKMIIETQSAQKISDNLGVEKEKIQNYLETEGLNEQVVKAAQNKLLSTEKEKTEAIDLLTLAKKQLKTSNEKSSGEVWRLLSSYYGKIGNVLIGYQNIVASLK